jgi:hypothetical protein
LTRFKIFFFMAWRGDCDQLWSTDQTQSMFKSTHPPFPNRFLTKQILPFTPCHSHSCICHPTSTPLPSFLFPQLTAFLPVAQVAHSVPTITDSRCQSGAVSCHSGHPPTRPAPGSSLQAGSSSLQARSSSLQFITVSRQHFVAASSNRFLKTAVPCS